MASWTARLLYFSELPFPQLQNGDRSPCAVLQTREAQTESQVKVLSQVLHRWGRLPQMASPESLSAPFPTLSWPSFVWEINMLSPRQ